MKYYSKKSFLFLIILDVLAIILTIFSAYILVYVSAIGCSLGCSPGYIGRAANEVVPSATEIVVFLIFSIIIFFLQQHANRHYGYLMIILVPFDIYIANKIFPGMLNLFFSSIKIDDLGILLIEGVITFSIAILVLATPFYVLGKLIKEDFLDKKHK